MKDTTYKTVLLGLIWFVIVFSLGYFSILKPHLFALDDVARIKLITEQLLKNINTHEDLHITDVLLSNKEELCDGIYKCHWWKRKDIRLFVFFNVVFLNVFGSWFSVVLLWTIIKFILFWYGWVKMAREVLKIPDFLVIGASLFIPSVVFWLSVMHPKSIFLASAGGMIYILQSRYLLSFIFGAISLFFWWQIASLIICILLLSKLRNFLYVAFFIVIIVFLILSTFPSWVYPICDMQFRMMTLLGESSFNVFPLCVTFDWTLKRLLFAPILTFISPLLGWGTEWKGIVFFLENIFSVLLFAFSYLFALYKQRHINKLPVVIFFVLFLAQFTLIGALVNNAGAIVRYRTFALFLINLMSLALFLAENYKEHRISVSELNVSFLKKHS